MKIKRKNLSNKNMLNKCNLPKWKTHRKFEKIEFF